jgi:ABC-type uncharacterized transport system ATPase subunit
MSNLSIENSETITVEMRSIWKRFPGVIANRGVNLKLYPGEVHALLGENGAGKSTLMNILAGLYRLDAGEILINGKRVDIRSPEHAIDLGIGMVHQNFRLVDNMTVAENVYLGWKTTPWQISRTKLASKLEPISKQLGFPIDTHAEVWQLSVGEQQRAEILRIIARGAHILIMDEPTAVLTPGEAKQLFTALRQLAQNGQVVVFISHKLDEVLEVSDRITVLRSGINIATHKTSECNQHILAKLMVGREIALQRPTRNHSSGQIILELKGIEAFSDRSLPALQQINLELYGGEILGIAGVAGNGQSELAEVLTGLRRPKSGNIKIAGIELTGKSPMEFARAGVGHIPEDRTGTGLFQSLPLTHSAILRKYRNPPIRNGLRLRWPAAQRYAQELIDSADIRSATVDTQVGTLSGGNQQKLLTSREIDIASHLLVAVHPTRGLDVGATEAVRHALIDYRDKGNAVLLVSEDLDELLLISDRIAVMYEGKIMGIVDADLASREEIGLLMGGVSLYKGKTHE